MERTIIAGSGVNVEYLPNGTRIGISRRDRSVPAELEVSAFRVTADGNDDFTGVEMEGDAATGQTVQIAKPYRLRRAGYHGQTITYTFAGQTWRIGYSYTAASYRTATILAPSGQPVENQAIVPTYNPNESTIFAVKLIGRTGVSGVDWLDLNLDAREWAKY